MANPQIIYTPAGGTQQTLSFASPPQQQPGYLKTAIRHDNVSTSGVRESVLERIDQFAELNMEWIRSGDDLKNARTASGPVVDPKTSQDTLDGVAGNVSQLTGASTQYVAGTRPPGVPPVEGAGSRPPGSRLPFLAVAGEGLRFRGPADDCQPFSWKRWNQRDWWSLWMQARAACPQTP